MKPRNDDAHGQVGEVGTAGESKLPEHHSTLLARRPRKWQRVLRAFLEGRTLNRFEAAVDLRDWCLHSTASGLQRRNLIIHRRNEVVPGAFGPVHCCRYWLAPGSFDLARKLLGLPAAAPREQLDLLGQHHQEHVHAQEARHDEP